jgi:hypothetical protein
LYPIFGIGSLQCGPRISKNSLFRLPLKLSSVHTLCYISGRRKIRKREEREVAIMAVLAHGDVEPILTTAYKEWSSSLDLVP